MANSQPSPKPEPAPKRLGSTEPAAVSFQALAGGAKEVLVEHAGQVYRLRLTKNGKLILNK